MSQLAWQSKGLRHCARRAVALAACLTTLVGAHILVVGDSAEASPTTSMDKLGWVADPPGEPGPVEPGVPAPSGPAPGPVAPEVPPAPPGPAVGDSGMSPSPVDSGAAPGSAPAPENAEVDEPASPEDCQIIRSTTGRIDVLAMRVAPVSDPFPTKESGEAVVDSDLTMLNSIVTLAVTAGANLQNPREKNKFELFKNAVIAMSAAYTERRSQDLTKPAKAEWAAQLAQLLDAWTKTYTKILNSCYV